METKDDALVAIEAGEGLTPIHVENTDISQNPMQQSQTHTSGIRFEIFEAVGQPCKDNLPHPIRVKNTVAPEGKNTTVTAAKQNQEQTFDEET